MLNAPCRSGLTALKLFLVAALVGCGATSATGDGSASEGGVDSSMQADSESAPEGVSEAPSTPILLVKNDATSAEAAAALGCVGDVTGAPVNLQQLDDAPFESLYLPMPRPWLVKIQDAGVTSGKLKWGPDANLDFIERSLRAYDMSAEAFTVAALLDSKWSVLSSLWRESLNYGLERFNAGADPLDAANEVFGVYESPITAACREAIEAAREQAGVVGVPLSGYLYSQTSDYLVNWWPDNFTESSVGDFMKQFEIVDE